VPVVGISMKLVLNILLGVFAALTSLGAVPWEWEDGIKGIHEIAMDNEYSADPNSSYQRWMNKAQNAGTKHAVINIVMHAIFPSDSAELYSYGAHQYCVHWSEFEKVRQKVRDHTARGIRVCAVLTLSQQANPNLYVGPSSPVAGQQAVHYAINAENASNGSNPFRAMMHLLASSFSDPQDALISAYIIGNEVQDLSYNYMNPYSEERLFQTYSKAIRAAWEEVSAVNSNIGIFASLNHNWSGGAGARAVIEQLASRCGDVPWGIAYHPYPSSESRDPWLDGLEFDDPIMVGMNNIDVLTSLANAPHVRCNGVGRRIIFSEQGLCDDGIDAKGSAGYAYFYIRALKSPLVRALHWMSHQDKVYGAYDGGTLKTFGLLRNQQIGSNQVAWDGAAASIKPVYSVYEAAGQTDNYDSLPYSTEMKSRLGILQWSDLNPSVVPQRAGSCQVVNLSHRGLVRNGSSMRGGFVIAGGAKKVLLRGVGATLALFHVPDHLQNPRMRLERSGVVLAQNNDWQQNANASEISAVPVGWILDSKDCAVLTTLESGVYNVIIDSEEAGQEGVALFEIYDLEGSGRLVNISTRCDVMADGGRSYASVVIAGTGTKSLLVRAVGPGLAPFGVSGYLQDPILSLARNAYQVAKNDNVGTAIYKYEIDAAAQRLGAFPISNSGLDSAMWVRLEPGSHSFVVEPKPGSAGGDCLIELYIDE
jgi:hypothetical protein